MATEHLKSGLYRSRGNNRSARALGVLVLAFLSLATAADAAVRGRPQVYRNTLVSDAWTLLRGVMYNTDLSGGVLPARSYVTKIRDNGMNALHVYAESPFCPTAPGSFLGSIQTLKDWTSQDGLYLVVTIGNGDCANWPAGSGWRRTAAGTCELCSGGAGCDLSSNKFNPTFTKCFWEKYAPALAASTHVVFEIHNEPYFYKKDSDVISQPSIPSVIDLEADNYDVIRDAAPATPVLLFSYGSLHDVDAIQSDWNALANTLQQRYGRSLTNVAVAFHTYSNTPEIGQDVEQVRENIRALRVKNIPIIGTELPWGNTTAECGGLSASATNPCLSFPDVAMLEEEEVSWLSFLRIGGHLTSASTWTNRVRKPIQNGQSGNGIGIAWEPDSGTWPAVHQPPCGKTAAFLDWDDKWVSGSAKTVWIGDGPLTADRETQGVWEEFTVSCTTLGAYLKAPSINRFVDPGWTSDTSPLWANASSASSSMAMRWLKLWDGKVALRVRRPYSNTSRPTWRFVSADRNRTFPNDPELIDNRTRVGPWEKFTVTSW